MPNDLLTNNTLLSDEILLERGHAALIAALGAQGAMQFLAIHNVSDGLVSSQRGRKSVGLQVGIPASGTELMLRFSRPVSWMRLDPSEARAVATKLVEGAKVLEIRSGLAAPITYGDTGEN